MFFKKQIYSWLVAVVQKWWNVPAGNCPSVVIINHCCYMAYVCLRKKKTDFGHHHQGFVSVCQGIKWGSGKCQRWSSFYTSCYPQNVFLLLLWLFWQRTPSIIAGAMMMNLLWLPFRFIGSAKIPLRDLASGQARSLPSRNVPLMNEKQQAVGVTTTDYVLYNTDFFFN